MRKLNFILAILLMNFASKGQNSFTRKFPERFQLDLPTEWINTPKLMRAITEILPKTLEVLKDKDFCTDCEAGYSLRLVIDMPFIKSRNNISKGIEHSLRHYSMEIVYQFRAALELYDSSGNNVIDLVLVMPEEEHIKRKDTAISTFDYSRPLTIKDANGGTVNRVWIPSINPAPINNNLFPDLNELMVIAEQRVYSIRDILKRD